MPTISVLRSEFYKQLNTTLDLEELDNLCFDFGIEYDGTEVNDCGQEVLKIEIPANRYDLLCVEGLVTALLSYRWDVKPPNFILSPSKPNPNCKIVVSNESSSIRPYIFSAILRNVKVTDENYKSLIDLQEKLHQNICRNRVLAAVGVHDLDYTTPPFTYGFEPPECIIFSPLTDGTRVYNCIELMNIYESHPKLKAYTKILHGSSLYPVLRDSTGMVCSFPPIINSYKTRLTLNTNNIFIEVTATDKIKGSIVLNQIIACFSKYCQQPFNIEPVLVEYQNDTTYITPDLSTRIVNASVDYISSRIGVENLTAKDITKLLNKMMIPSNILNDNTIEAIIPITRSDIQHQCDLAEDVAIAYGYNNIKKKYFSMGKLQEKTLLSNRIRSLLISAGYKETLMPILDSFKSAYHNMNWNLYTHPDDVADSSPPEVTASRSPAVSTSNYLSLKGGATPGDRGDKPVADLREAEGEVNRGGRHGECEKTTSSGENGVKVGYGDKKPHNDNKPHDSHVLQGEVSTGPQVEPGSDPRELEGEVNKEATTAVGRDVDEYRTSSVIINGYHLPVTIKNSQVVDQELLRTSLIPGILRTIFNRKASILPIRLYEIGDVVWRYRNSELGAINNTMCTVAYSNISTAGLEDIQGVSEFLLNSLGFISEYQIWELNQMNSNIPEIYKYRYELKENDDPAFLPGRHVSFIMTSEPHLTIGKMGIIHPTVLHNFHITMPVSVFELDLTLIKKLIYTH